MGDKSVGGVAGQETGEPVAGQGEGEGAREPGASGRRGVDQVWNRQGRERTAVRRAPRRRGEAEGAEESVGGRETGAGYGGRCPACAMGPDWRPRVREGRLGSWEAGASQILEEEGDLGHQRGRRGRPLRGQGTGIGVDRSPGPGTGLARGSSQGMERHGWVVL